MVSPNHRFICMIRMSRRPVGRPTSRCCNHFRLCPIEVHLCRSGSCLPLCLSEVVPYRARFRPWWRRRCPCSPLLFLHVLLDMHLVSILLHPTHLELTRSSVISSTSFSIRRVEMAVTIAYSCSGFSYYDVWRKVHNFIASRLG